MSHRKFQIAWLVAILITAALACNFITGLDQDVSEARQTALVVATQAQGLATEVGQSGLLKTAQAYATQEGSKALATAEALATQAEESGILETAKAFATKEGSILLATIQAKATQGLTSGEAPHDIPVLDQKEIEDYFSSPEIVSYSTAVDFASILEFYKSEMPANGWTAKDEGTVETNNAAVLHYTKQDRLATITISVNPINQETNVVILIEAD